MQDMNETSKRKRRETNLGMAKNGAVVLLKDTKLPHWARLYKGTAKLLFQMNEELDREILDAKDAKTGDDASRGMEVPI